VEDGEEPPFSRARGIADGLLLATDGAGSLY